MERLQTQQDNKTMEKFNKLTSSCVPLPIQNVDTDQIIPARFLKATTKDGFGNHLFADWRYDKMGNQKKEFVLNNPIYSGQILVAGANFGSGSSREHAAWAVGGYGFRVVISSYFADIFKNNALNNGILPIVVSSEFLTELFNSIEQNPKTEVYIDLIKQEVVNKMTTTKEYFEINPYKKKCLLEGLDDIDYLLSNRDKIEYYEKSRVFSY